MAEMFEGQKRAKELDFDSMQAYYNSLLHNQDPDYEKIADSMDMDGLISYVIGSISYDLKQSKIDFYKTIENYDFEEVN